MSIGAFVLLSEGSVGSCVLRIEAITSGEAWALLDARSREAAELRSEIETLRKEAKKQPAAAAAVDADYGTRLAPHR